MSRPAKTQGPYLYWRDERVRNGKIVERAQWVIRDRDGNSQKGTGCAKGDLIGANRALDAYLTTKHNPRGASDPASALIADALNVYTQDVINDDDKFPGGESNPRYREAKQRIARLTDFFGGMLIITVSKDACTSYIRERGAKSAARRELEDLRAALKYYAEQGYTTIVPAIRLPEKNESRKEWLTVKQAARLLRAAWQMRQSWGDGDDTARRIGRHLAHFIVVALHSGTRRTVTCTAALERMPGRPYFDLDDGIFYRTPDNARTNKKNRNQGPQTVPLHLLAHLRRWQRRGQRFAVEWNGLPPGKINKAFRHACNLAGLDAKIVPHTLRHTCVTWMLKNGITTHATADFVGMTEEMVRRVYGHHCPEHQKEAANHRLTARQKRLAAKEVVEFQNARRLRLVAAA